MSQNNQMTEQELRIAAELLAQELIKGLTPRLFPVCLQLFRDFDASHPKPTQKATLQLEPKVEAGIFYRIEKHLLERREEGRSLPRL